MTASLGSRIAAGAAWMVVLKVLDRSIGIVAFRKELELKLHSFLGRG